MNFQNLNVDELLNHLTEAIAVKVSERIQITPSTNEKETDQDEYLDTIQTLDFINIKTRVTLDKYVLEGRIDKPIKRGGRKLYYKKSSLLKFLQNG
jgi:hypothetical protein